ncbi:MAG: HDOD domain-containing protein [Deltaproteobacteria bacterium]|nr:HDOD domain-containing protein [Deltaproteobacteria bacterium]
MTIAMPLDPLTVARARATDPRIEQTFARMVHDGWTPFAKEVYGRKDSPDSPMRLMQRHKKEWKHIQKVLLQGELFNRNDVDDLEYVSFNLGSAFHALVCFSSLLHAHDDHQGVRGFSQARMIHDACETALRCQNEYSDVKLREQAFAAGLLHDVGLFMLTVRFPEEMEEVLHIATGERRSLVQAERVRFGFDHQAVGAFYLEKLRFSARVVDAVACHHEPHPDADLSLGAIVARVQKSAISPNELQKIRSTFCLGGSASPFEGRVKKAG